MSELVALENKYHYRRKKILIINCAQIISPDCNCANNNQKVFKIHHGANGHLCKSMLFAFNLKDLSEKNE